MKTSSWIILVILAIVAIIFGAMWVNSANKAKTLMKSNEELQALYESSTSTLNEIQSSLDSMDADLFGSIGVVGEAPGSTPEERRSQLMSTITKMRSQIEADKKRIASLESQLANSKNQLASIQNIVNKLKASVADKEKIVAELEGRLGEMSATLDSERQQSQAEIAKRESLLKDKEGVISNQTYESNRQFYVVGTRKELINKGIINRKGGILGIGRVSVVTKEIDTSKFTEFNLLDQQTISFPVTKKGYAVLSNHVAASYKVEKEGDEYVLTVTDPDHFRKQKFLVIELL
jgi:uncharacterized coiled-coil protein SlyX